MVEVMYFCCCLMKIEWVGWEFLFELDWFELECDDFGYDKCGGGGVGEDVWSFS